VVYGTWREGSWERNSQSLLGSELPRLEGKRQGEILIGINWPWIRAGASRFLETTSARSGMSFARGIREIESKAHFWIFCLHFREGSFGGICSTEQGLTWEVSSVCACFRAYARLKRSPALFWSLSCFSCFCSVLSSQSPTFFSFFTKFVLLCLLLEIYSKLLKMWSCRCSGADMAEVTPQKRSRSSTDADGYVNCPQTSFF